eukprot:1159813-Pelagomonas_calceolata.AAC.30
MAPEGRWGSLPSTDRYLSEASAWLVWLPHKASRCRHQASFSVQRRRGKSSIRICMIACNCTESISGIHFCLPWPPTTLHHCLLAEMPFALPALCCFNSRSGAA